MPIKTELVLLLRRNFSLVARYSLKFTCCSLLPVKSLVTRCRSCSVQKITPYSLQKLLVAKKSLVTGCKICSLLVAEVACCKKSLFTRSKICSLLVAGVARCKKLLVTRCEIRSLLVAEVESLFATL